MADLRIPDGYLQGFQVLINIDENAFSKFVAALGTSKPMLRVKDYVQQITSTVPQISAHNMEVMLEMILSLYYLLSIRDETVSSLVDKLTVAVETEEKLIKPTEWNPIQFSERLARLLSLNNSLDVVAKASGILTDNERIYCDARIITDIRPIFGSEVSSQPNAFVLVHLLKIGFHENGKHQGIFFALDSEDLVKLRNVLERAEEKVMTLKNLIVQHDWAYLDTEASEKNLV